MSWQDHNGKRHTHSARTTDKATAERIAAKLEADVALRRDGVIDPALDTIRQQSQRSIKDHLTDYRAKLKAANRDRKHIRTTISYIRKISDAAGFFTIGDMTADGVNGFAAELQEAGRSARTIQAHLTAIKGFTRWLAA